MQAEQRPRLRLGALMTAERYDDALAIVETLPPVDRLDPDVLLLTAIIQVERGQLDQAAQLCASMLALDDLNATAHYLTGLCHEHGGRRAAAIDSYRVGVYLDSAFAMPHLRLGLMFRRDGDLLECGEDFDDDARSSDRNCGAENGAIDAHCCDRQRSPSPSLRKHRHRFARTSDLRQTQGKFTGSPCTFLRQQGQI